MELVYNEENLAVLKSLASEPRLKIIQALTEDSRNLSQLAESLNLSKTIIGKHAQALAEAGIIRIEELPAKSGTQKRLHLKVDTINLHFPKKIYTPFEKTTQVIPIGHYSAYEALPTCGLASVNGAIGEFDDPRFFMDPRKAEAGMLWFADGYVEYLFPNLLARDVQPEILEFSMELSSEFPFSNNVWPSDISFSLNDRYLGMWTAPGDFSDTRGKYTPDWWLDNGNQYGILVQLRILHDGVYINAKKVSNKGLGDLRFGDYWKFRIYIRPDAVNKGGLTIFGKGFGNYDQDILFSSYLK